MELYNIHYKTMRNLNVRLPLENIEPQIEKLKDSSLNYEGVIYLKKFRKRWNSRLPEEYHLAH